MKEKENSSKSMNKMGTMPVGRLIFSMSWPAMLSMLMQAFYNVVDSFFVSLISDKALAVVTYIFPVQMLIISVAVGTGVGINSLISRRLGAKRYDEADRAASHGYRLSFISWAVFAVAGSLCAGPMMDFMSDTPYVVRNGTWYMILITAGSLFCIVQMITEKILQATGNMKIPMLSSLTGVFLNILLDPLMIFGIGPFPEMGVLGAAVATLTAQLISMLLSQFFLFGIKHAVKVKVRGWKMDAAVIRDIYAVGAPSILMQSIFSVMQFGMNIILGSVNEMAVAVIGVYGRLQSFIFMPVFGLNQGILPIMGFNYGARNRKRLMQTYRKALLTASAIMMTGFLVFQIFPYQLMSLFNSGGSREMYDLGIPALKIISLCFLPAAFGIISSSIFQAIGHGFLSLWGALLRQVFIILPAAYIFTIVSGLKYVWFAFPISEIAGVFYFIIALKYIYDKDIRHLDSMHM